VVELYLHFPIRLHDGEFIIYYHHHHRTAVIAQSVPSLAVPTLTTAMDVACRGQLCWSDCTCHSSLFQPRSGYPCGNCDPCSGRNGAANCGPQVCDNVPSTGLSFKRILHQYRPQHALSTKTGMDYRPTGIKMKRR